MANRTASLHYLSFKRELEDLLYELDPYGMGSSVGAPRDEYSDEAARVMPLLLRIASGGSGETAADLPWTDDILCRRAIDLAERHGPYLSGPVSG